jgi:DNA-directed RNA polymerase subunit RPC12/RpoP
MREHAESNLMALERFCVLVGVGLASFLVSCAGLLVAAVAFLVCSNDLERQRWIAALPALFVGAGSVLLSAWALYGLVLVMSRHGARCFAVLVSTPLACIASMAFAKFLNDWFYIIFAATFGGTTVLLLLFSGCVHTGAGALGILRVRRHLRMVESYGAPPRCEKCGYDLANLADDAACPECGGRDRMVIVRPARPPPSQ